MISKDEIKLARAGAKGIGSLDSMDRHDALEGILARTYALKGYSVEGGIFQELQEILRAVEPKLATRHSTLTLGEVSLAWEYGVCGDFGEDKRITIANLLSWLSRYSSLEERKEAIEALFRESRPSRLLPAQDLERRNQETGRRWALRQWDFYKENGMLEPGLLDGFAASIYDYLEGMQKVHPTPASIREARSRASSTHGAKTRADSATKEKDAQVIGDIVQPPGNGLNYAIKRELLEMYFSALKTRGVELRL